MGERKDLKDEEKRKKKAGIASAKVQSPAAAGRALLDKLEDVGYATGYETDAGPSTSAKKKLKLKKRPKPSGSGVADAGYETDDGYLSSSGKASSGKVKGKSSRFFKLGNKSKTNVDVEERLPLPEPVPPIPAFKTPIAARFATTLNLDAPAAAEPLLRSPVVPPPPSSAPSATTPQADARKPESLPDFPPSKWHGGLNFGSDTSDHGGSSGPSIFSRIASSSSSSPTTSSSMSHSNVPQKVPVISLPLTRSPSPPSHPPPLPGITPHKAGVKHIPDPLSFSAQRPTANNIGGSPAASPFVLLTPIDTSAPIPSETMSPSSARKNRAGFFNRAVDDLMKPKSRQDKDLGFTSSPASNHMSPDLSLQRSRSPQGQALIIPSQEYVVPSPRVESLEPPLNTFSYYELPPPSPPPDSPLPRTPDGYESAANLPPENSLRPPRMMSPSSSRPSSPLGRPGAISPINAPQRGRESPFPARPILPNAPAVGLPKMPTGRIPGLEARRNMNVPRYRDLYVSPPSGVGNRTAAPQSYRTPNLPQPSGYQSDGIASAPATYNNYHRTQRSEESQPAPKSRPQRYGVRFEEGQVDVRGASEDDEGWGMGYGDEDDEDDDIRAVANHYNPSSRQRERDEPALGRSTSFEALQGRYRDAAQSGLLGSTAPASGSQDFDYDSDNKSHYPNDEAGGGDRSTLYTIASNYSAGDLSVSENRASIMDRNRSEQNRDRFVKRIEAMFDANGRELPSRDRVPPVPKVPQGAVANAVRTGGWF